MMMTVILKERKNPISSSSFTFESILPAVMARQRLSVAANLVETVKEHPDGKILLVKSESHGHWWTNFVQNGKFKPVIKKAMVELDGAPFSKFASMRDEWALKNRYISPGPIQFTGPGSNDINHTLLLELGAQAA